MRESGRLGGIYSGKTSPTLYQGRKNYITSLGSNRSDTTQIAKVVFNSGLKKAEVSIVRVSFLFLFLFFCLFICFCFLFRAGSSEEKVCYLFCAFLQKCTFNLTHSSTAGYPPFLKNSGSGAVIAY